MELDLQHASAQVISTYPYDIPQPVDPLFFIAFDQRIDPAAVLETIQVSAGSQRSACSWPAKPKSRRMQQVKHLVKYAQEGRWLAFKAKEPLPADTTDIGDRWPRNALGRRSAGHQRSAILQLLIPMPRCASSNQAAPGPISLPPLDPFYIRFNNPIDVRPTRNPC